MLLYHYTNIDAAVNIIKNGLCFWGFRYDSMNDPTDFVFARDNVLPKLLEQVSEEEREGFSNVFPYIVSFCKKRDYDLMWRLYQGEIALVIDTDKLPLDEWDKEEEYSKIVSHREVAYASSENIDEITEILYESRPAAIENSMIDEFLRYVLPFIKHEAYSMENEYRLVKSDYESSMASYNPNKPDMCDISETEIPNEVKCFGTKDGMLRFYKEFNLGKDALVGLILHTFDEATFQMQKKHFELWLMQCGFDPTYITIEMTKSYPIR